MLPWLRRYLVLLALGFWMGGFTFYGAVVIPIGRREFDGMFGAVTSPVTYWLNVAGAVALAFLFWDRLAAGDPLKWRGVVRWLMWLVSVGLLIALFFMHNWLDTLMATGETLPHGGSFGLAHRSYLWVSTAQWFAMLIYTGLTLAAWRKQDEQRGRGPAT